MLFTRSRRPPSFLRPRKRWRRRLRTSSSAGCIFCSWKGIDCRIKLSKKCTACWPTTVRWESWNCGAGLLESEQYFHFRIFGPTTG